MHVRANEVNVNGSESDGDGDEDGGGGEVKGMTEKEKRKAARMIRNRLSAQKYVLSQCDHTPSQVSS